MFVNDSENTTAVLLDYDFRGLSLEEQMEKSSEIASFKESSEK